MNDNELQRFKQQLAQQRAELTAALQMAQSSTEPVKLDQSSVGRVSRMDAMQSQSMAVETTRLKQQQLRRISAALALIQSGDYGYCSECDNDIDLRQLEIDPSATMCVPCASQQE